MQYLDEVKEVVGTARIIIGMDANAVSSSWYSKNIRYGSLPEVRGQALDDWILANDYNIMNEPSSWYMFSNFRGQSDIDVTLYSGNWGRGTFRWQVKVEGNSDHNIIDISISTRRERFREVDIGRVWTGKNICWRDYGICISNCSDWHNIKEYTTSLAMLELIDGWIVKTNNSLMKRVNRVRVRRNCWWNDGELANEAG